MELPQSKVQIYSGGDPVGWIISANIHRRHLSKQEKADAIVAALRVAERAKDNAEKLDQVEPVSPGGRGKINETKAKAISIGETHGLSKSTIKRALANGAGKKANREKLTGQLVLSSIVFERSKLPTITKEQWRLIASKLQEIAQIVSGASSLISYRQRADSLTEIESAAEANSK
jgi:hypothetical protein